MGEKFNIIYADPPWKFQTYSERGSQLKSADADRTEYIYFEQDGMTATLYNWLNGRLSISQIEALKCEIIVPEDGEEHKTE